MPEVTPRRQRRVLSPEVVTAEPAQQQGTAIATVKEIMRQRDDAVRRADYRILGQFSRAETSRGVIQFPGRTGPTIGYVGGTHQLAVLTEWTGLPFVRTNTENPCPACLAACDVCDADGKHGCRAFQCGGSGTVPRQKPCSQKTHSPECECQGAGVLKYTEQCSTCGGTGRMTCQACKGTHKVATGNEGGSLSWRSPRCPACKGTRFSGEDVAQPESKFVNARLGSMVFLGPIVRFAVDSVGGSGEPPSVFDVDADTSGNYLVLLIDHEDPGIAATCALHGQTWEEDCDSCRRGLDLLTALPARGAYLIGGVLKSVARGA